MNPKRGGRPWRRAPGGAQQVPLPKAGATPVLLMFSNLSQIQLRQARLKLPQSHLMRLHFIVLDTHSGTSLLPDTVSAASRTPVSTSPLPVYNFASKVAP